MSTPKTGTIHVDTRVDKQSNACGFEAHTVVVTRPEGLPQMTRVVKCKSHVNIYVDTSV